MRLTGTGRTAATDGDRDFNLRIETPNLPTAPAPAPSPPPAPAAPGQ